MCDVRTGVVLLIFIIGEVAATASFQLELLDFNNDNGLLADNSCCSGTRNNEICTQQCSTYFKICVKPFQRHITKDNCLFGEFVTNVLGNNSFGFPRAQGAFTNPLIFSFPYSWRGDFSLIVEAYHEATVNGQEDQLIASFQGSDDAAPQDGWTILQWSTSSIIPPPQSLRFKFQLRCDENFFGEGCTKECSPRDDDLGHYECDDNGNTVCKQGWRGEYCSKAICLEGCSTTHGNCVQPNQCECHVGWTGKLCDECETYPECQNGYCTEEFECICRDGWGGVFCNQDLNYCANNKPCQNGGTCTNTGQGYFTCTCPDGFTGTNCELEVDNCEADTCLNGGVCQDIGNDYLCRCPDGYSGLRCEVDAARCEQNPCANGATCEPVGSSYRCHCAPGWEGVDCQHERNECMGEENHCLNGGSCVDEMDSYTCVCAPGFHGRHCEVNTDECGETNRCLNGGVCKDGLNRFYCVCPDGFHGSMCQLKSDPCRFRPCANGGTCRSDGPNFMCLCVPGYGGRMCNEQINECIGNPCQNFGRCEDLINGYKCHCNDEFVGAQCQYKAGEVPASSLFSSASPRVTLTPGPDSAARPQVTPSTTAVIPSGVSVKTGSIQSSNKDVALTQPQLILIVCLGSGIPMCLLFVLVTILLCRRCRKQAGNKSEEARQNEINGMNNRIHNPVTDKSGLYDYPTAEKKILNELESPALVHQIPLDYKNSAAAQPVTAKVMHKGMIKDINRELQQLNIANTANVPQHPSPLTVTEQYPCIPYYTQDRRSSIAAPPRWTHSNDTNSNVDSNIISTVCDTVHHTAASLPQSADTSVTGSSCDYTSQQQALQSPYRHSHHGNSSSRVTSQHRHHTQQQVTDSHDFTVAPKQQNGTATSHSQYTV